jgi:hypothetical protein
MGPFWQYIQHYTKLRLFLVANLTVASSIQSAITMGIPAFGMIFVKDLLARFLACLLYA